MGTAPVTPLSRIIEHIKTHPEFLRDRANFYHLRSWADQVRADHGLGAAMGASAELWAEVGYLTECSPTMMRQGHRFICEMAHGILSGSHAGSLTYLNTVMTEGDFVGHPTWHTENPWFHAWHAATADTSQVGAHWAQNPAVTQPRDLAYAEGLLKSFTETPNPGRDELAKLILEFIEAEGRPPVLLDIGCGVGNWLAWCVKYAGANAADCYGVDPLPGRIAGAQALGATVGIPANNFAAIKTELPKGLQPDIVMLCAVDGCMTDEGFDDLLYRISDLGNAPRTAGRVGPPAYVFESGVLDSWSAWIGRSQEQMDTHFARVGYKRLRSKLTGSILTRENLSSLVLPLKYFDSGRCSVYEKT